MARKKVALAAVSPDAPQRAVDAAVSLLISQMEALNASVVTCLSVWDEGRSDPHFQGDYYVRTAVKLARVSGQLGETLAKIRSEHRQHISVERLAAPSGTAGEGPPLSTPESLKRRENLVRSPGIEGEGGGGGE